MRGLRFERLLVRFFMPERIQKPVEPAPWGPKQGDGGSPRSPDISRPDTKDLLKKMRRVDPNQSKRYRQRKKAFVDGKDLYARGADPVLIRRRGGPGGTRGEGAPRPRPPRV